jgi:CRP-like cAMP-binding protein
MTNEELIKPFFQQFGILNEAEIDKIIEATTSRKLKRGEYFIGKGVISNEFAFVKKGFFRHFLRDSSGEEKTYYLTFPNQIIASYSSLISGDETQEYIESITDAEIIVISLQYLENTFENNINWLKFSKLIVKIQYLELEKRVFTLLNDSPKQRYLELLEHKPHYIQQIPLKYLSSYLGVSQRHLSRLRKEVTL